MENILTWLIVFLIIVVILICLFSKNKEHFQIALRDKILDYEDINVNRACFNRNNIPVSKYEWSLSPYAVMIIISGYNYSSIPRLFLNGKNAKILNFTRDATNLTYFLLIDLPQFAKWQDYNWSLGLSEDIISKVGVLEINKKYTSLHMHPEINSLGPFEIDDSGGWYGATLSDLSYKFIYKLEK